MFGRPAISPGEAIREVAAVAIIVSFLFAAISIDGNREQEAFNQGAIVLTLGDAAVCIVPLAVRAARGKASRGGVLLARRGFPILLVLSLATYMTLASMTLGRVP